MKEKKDLDIYWTCRYCGEHTSRELKSELCRTDHWDCIINEIIKDNQKLYNKKLDNE